MIYVSERLDWFEILINNNDFPDTRKRMRPCVIYRSTGFVHPNNIISATERWMRFYLFVRLFTGFGVEVLKVSPMLITTVSVCLLLVILATIVVVRLKSSANSRKRASRQPDGGGDKQVIVHQRSNGQVATSVLETDTDPDLIQVKYGESTLSCLSRFHSPTCYLSEYVSLQTDRNENY